MSERSDVKFQGGAPTRCPYCHDAVDRASDAWVACEGCLARHHAACWSETGACGACQETACVVPAGVAVEPRTARERTASATKKGDEPLDDDVAVHELALQGDPPVWLAAEQALVVLARAPDSVERLAVRVRNGTDRPQEIDLRTAPNWIVREGAAATAAPGETITLLLSARVADAPYEFSEEERPLPRRLGGCGYRLSTSITLRVGELVKGVPIDVVRPYTDATIKRWAWFLAFLFITPFVWINARSEAKPPAARGPFEPQAAWLLRRRLAVEYARHIELVEWVLIKWLALVVGVITLALLLA